MAYPQITDYRTGSLNTNGTSSSIIVPANITSGDLLVLFITKDGTGTFTTPANWTLLGQSAYGGQCHAIFYRQLTGSISNFTIAHASEQTTWVIVRIPSGSVPVINTVATGSSTTPNPTSLTSGFAANTETLYLASAGWDYNRTASGFPSNMSLYRYSSVGTTTGGCGTAIAGAESTAASFDPSNFTMGASDTWCAYTIAISYAFDPNATVIQDTVATATAETPNPLQDYIAILRKTAAGGTYALHAFITDINATEYTDCADLEDDEEYYYKVAIVQNGAIVGNYSNEAHVVYSAGVDPDITIDVILSLATAEAQNPIVNTDVFLTATLSESNAVLYSPTVKIENNKALNATVYSTIDTLCQTNKFIKAFVNLTALIKTLILIILISSTVVGSKTVKLCLKTLSQVIEVLANQLNEKVQQLVEKLITVVATTSAAAQRYTSKLSQAATSVIGTARRMSGKVLDTAASATAAIARASSKAVSTIVGLTSTLTKASTKALTNMIVTTSSKTKAGLKSLSALANTASSKAVSVTKATLTTIATAALRNSVVAKLLSIGQSVASSVVKRTGALLQAALTVTSSKSKSLLRLLTTSLSASGAVARDISKDVLITLSAIASSSKLAATTLVAAITGNPAARKAVAKQISTIVVLAGLFFKAIPKALAAVVESNVAVAKLIGKYTTAIVTGSVAVIKQGIKQLSTIVTFTASRLSSTSKSVIATLSTTSLMTRIKVLMRTFSTAMIVAVTLQRSIIKSVQAYVLDDIETIKSTTKHTIADITIAASSAWDYLEQMFQKALSTTLNIISTTRRNISKISITSVILSATKLVDAVKSLDAMISVATTVTRNTTKRLASNLTIAASNIADYLEQLVQKVLTASITISSSISRQIATTLATNITIIGTKITVITKSTHTLVNIVASSIWEQLTSTIQKALNTTVTVLAVPIKSTSKAVQINLTAVANLLKGRVKQLVAAIVATPQLVKHVGAVLKATVINVVVIGTIAAKLKTLASHLHIVGAKRLQTARVVTATLLTQASHIAIEVLHKLLQAGINTSTQITKLARIELSNYLSILTETNKDVARTLSSTINSTTIVLKGVYKHLTTVISTLSSIIADAASIAYKTLMTAVAASSTKATVISRNILHSITITATKITSIAKHTQATVRLRSSSLKVTARTFVNNIIGTATREWAIPKILQTAINVTASSWNKLKILAQNVWRITVIHTTKIKDAAIIAVHDLKQQLTGTHAFTLVQQVVHNIHLAATGVLQTTQRSKVVFKLGLVAGPDLSMVEGETQYIELEVVDELGESVILTEATALFAINSRIRITKTCSIDGNFVTAKLEPNDTIGIHGNYKYECRVKLPNSDVDSIILGDVTITKAVIPTMP